MYKYIYDPIAKKKLKIDSKRAKLLLSKYIKKLGGAKCLVETTKNYLCQ